MRIVGKIWQRKKQRNEALSALIAYSDEAQRTFCLIPIGFGRLCPGTVEDPSKHLCVQYQLRPGTVHPPLKENT